MLRLIFRNIINSSSIYVGIFPSIGKYSFEFLITKKALTCHHCVNLLHTNVCIDYCVAMMGIHSIVPF